MPLLCYNVSIKEKKERTETMSLQFILGGSGSGKSTYILKQIVERSIHEEQKRFFILVPDQFTMQTQMDVVSMHPREGIMNIDVLSFSRLSYRILEETGGNRQPVLDDTGKSLVLRKVAANLEDQLPILGSNLRKLGYIHEVKSAISEFMQYGIGEKEMEEMMSFSQKRGGLYGKLKDLSTLYGGFKAYLKDRYITTEETYDRLALQLQKSKLIKDSVIVLDGFTGFTPIQHKVIRQLMRHSLECYITLTIEGEKQKKEQLAEHDLFLLPSKTYASLIKIAQEEKVEIKEDIQMATRGIRFEKRKDLLHLERTLFSYPRRVLDVRTENIVFLPEENMEEEVRKTCRKIRELLQLGYAYRDIAIIAGDLPGYKSILEEIMGQYSIPVFFDETKEITLNPFIEFLRAAMGVMVKNYSYESMFHYLRSGMVSMEQEKIDILEQYCLAHGIKGKKNWSSLFVKGQKEGEDLELLNNLREQIMEDLQLLKPGKQKGKDLIDQLYAFLVKNKCAEKLQKYEAYFSSVGEKSKEKEYAQIYTLVMELMEQVHELLGEEILSWEELGQIMDAGFGEIQVGLIPQEVDQVVIGTLERTRLKQIKALFFLGMNEGKVPRTSSRGGILSDLDREFLAESSLELAPTPRQQLFIQKYYFYLMVTKPSHKLYLSYPALNQEGKSLKPSYFLEQIRALFPNQEEERKETEQIPRTYQEARLYVAKNLSKIKQGKAEEKNKRLVSALLPLLKEKNERWWEQLFAAAYYCYEPQTISKEAAKALYGAVLYSSVSRLEKMAACAFSHYLQYGLGLKERQEYQFEAVDLGNVFHGVLELFAGKLAEKNYTWIDFPLEEGRKILSQVLEAYAISYGNTILFSTARNAYGKRKIERILWRTVRTLQYQLQKGKFLPKNFELSFSSLEDLDSVTISLSQEEKLRLGGRIDRVDTFQEEDTVYVKVIDYKSGNQTFQLAALYHGLQLQLVMYLNAAMELEQRKNPKNRVEPGAFLYYHITDPMVEVTEELSGEEVEELIRRELRVNGIINEKPQVLQGIDSTHALKSEVAHLEYKKDGSLMARSQVMSADQIELLQQYAKKKAGDLGRQILSGEISMQPKVLKNRDACSFCSFKQICGFDEKLPGFEKQKLPELEEEEILKNMRRAVEGEEE